MSQSPSESISVVDAHESNRFEISVDGAFAGFTTYADVSAGGGGSDGGDGSVERTFPHTVIEEKFGGRGLATTLIHTALDAARVSGMTVIPECSAVQHFIAKHPDYVDLVPEARRTEFEL